jgi:hypothetical protein
MGRENRILCQGMIGATEKDLDLHVAYPRLSETEHRLNFARQQLDLTREEVDMRTHTIMHLENAIEMHDLKLEGRAKVIATLKQQF